ncbi:MAG: 2-oxoglutarate dehydrogenase complex dihydrolipoyllysine-residue succinyltransferase [Spirochaetaceae bacterium]|nr:MAG: 2-oxoglutarate dehydrogenase complex dihydrolipoyllysine-residue succinyltransferase [Spirochaetaceae bacterium]
MKQDVVVPQIGESVTSGILAGWLKQDGDTVAKGDELFELETDKATMSVPSPAAGVLRISVSEDTEVSVGQSVATVDTEAAEAGASAPAGKAAPVAESPPSAEQKPAEENQSAEAEKSAKPADEAGAKSATSADTLSPAVRRVVSEHNLDPADITGTGPGGRITKEDALAAAAASPASQPATPSPTPPASGGETGPRQRRVKMSNLRKRIAENLVRSKQGSAHLTTFNEIDMSGVMELRAQHKDRFAEKHGVKLGFMSFFVKAACNALADYPEANAFIDGTDILYNDYYNIGVALSSDKGLIVPVLRDADTKGFAAIESEILSFIGKAKEKRLSPDELTGGTFTISNGGVFGSMLSTPIPSPPQTAVLGMHAIQKRAVVVNDQIVIRPMMYLALTYDHRIIDGREAVGLLNRIKQQIEDPTQMLLDL